MRGARFERAAFLVGQLARAPCRGAYDQRPIGEHFALRDQRPCADQTIFADHGVAQDHGADADQAVIADRAAVDRGAVPDGDVVAYGARCIAVDVQHGGVLHVAAIAEANVVAVAA